MFILGTTASGKSKLSLDLAKLYDGEIINADSMQIYAGNDAGIMTAKPVPDDLKITNHHLYSELDMISIVDFNVKKYKKMALDKIGEVMSRGRLPIVVGGTNYYIESLLFEDQETTELDIPQLFSNSESFQKFYYQFFNLLIDRL